MKRTTLILAAGIVAACGSEEDPNVVPPFATAGSGAGGATSSTGGDMSAGGMSEGGMGGDGGMSEGGMGGAGGAGGMGGTGGSSLDCDPGEEPSGGSCVPCTAGTFSADGLDCLPWTDCGSGTEPTSTPDASTDRVCGACAAGTFSAGSNDACVAWTDCGSGTEPTNTPDASTDRTCGACAAGTFSLGNNDACVAWSDCGAGTEPTNTPNASTDRTCGACAAGTFSAGSNDACAGWTDCVAGQRVDQMPSATQDRGCVACSTGTFSTMSNVATCTPFTNCGTAYIATPGTPTSDRSCCNADLVGDQCSYDISGYTLALDFDIPTTGDLNTPADVVYAVDDTSALGNYTRIAYVLQLDESYVWAEMDDFTSDDASALGVPVDWVFDQPVTNLTLRSNDPSIIEVTNATGGAIEFWHFNYSPGADGLFDVDDDIGPTADGFGSMQIHRGARTELAFNRWSVTSLKDVGIGPGPAGAPDWTSTELAALFQTRRLRVYVLEVGIAP